MKLSEIVEKWRRFSGDDPDVVHFVGNEFVEVCGIVILNDSTMMLQTVNPTIGGAIVIDPEMTPMNPGG